LGGTAKRSGRQRQRAGDSGCRHPCGAFLGGLDILVNNAGIARGGPLESMTLADIDALINVNIRGVVIAIQEALVHMSDGGRIINIGSCLANRVAMPGIAVYSMTKSALNSLTRGLRAIWAARHYR
jgi:NAD(P)-dependent dehydrogenase (short-subunit alcohol dehydrogenase family)